MREAKPPEEGLRGIWSCHSRRIPNSAAAAVARTALHRHDYPRAFPPGLPSVFLDPSFLQIVCKISYRNSTYLGFYLASPVRPNLYHEVARRTSPAWVGSAVLLLLSRANLAGRPARSRRHRFDRKWLHQYFPRITRSLARKKYSQRV